MQLYDDAGIPIMGAKHPHEAMGPLREVFPDLWPHLEPMFEEIERTGRATWAEAQLLPIVRSGFLEEVYFTWSYSPVRDESGAVVGFYTPAVEATGQVLGQRRLRTLHAITHRAIGADSVEDAGRAALSALAENAADVPFALLYLADAQGERASLLGACGVDPRASGAPERVDLREGSAGDKAGWLLGPVARSRQAAVVDGIDAWLGALPDPTGLGAPRSAMVLPLLHAEGQRAFGFLVVGVSPRLALAGEYRRFLGLAAGAVATAAADARAQHEAKERAEKLAALDRAKTAFFSNVSHEFRTPLTLLLAPVEEALATGEASLSRETLAMVHRSGTRLLKLVNTLLDFSRIEAGRAEGVYEPTDLSAYTTNLASAFRSLVEKAGLTLSVDCPPLPEPVWVDREMWEKIVMNLLSNAFKFTLEGEIAVTLERAGRQAQLTVRDTGIGMAAAELPHAFERFHRVAGARGRSHEGTGIGLALVRELVQMHGGTVRVESEVGRGSRFLVSLPLDRGPLAAAAPPRARTLPPTPVRAAAFLDEAAGWLAAPEARDAAEPLALAGVASAGAAPAAAPREARILLADDNADMRAYVEQLLRAQGWRVSAVADGQAALESARADPPDLVLTDVMMPRLGGFGLLRALRAEERTRTLPILLLSARAGQEATVEGLEAGADDYLVKPFSARELVARVGAALAIARLRQERFEAKQAQADALQQRMEFEQRLIGIVSHDLRNPLNAIALAAAAQADEVEAGAVGAKTVRVIRAAAERATRLVQDLLDVTRARHGGGLPITRQSSDLHRITQAVLDEIRAAHPDRVVLAREEGDAHGDWDADRVGQVVQNLVVNALKYSPRGSCVGVATRGDEGSASLRVHNEGAPISPALLPRLFEPFERGAGEAGAASRSVGLGLYIVRQIVDAHGGTVDVTSSAAEGTTFTVRLPRQRPV